ncbi:MAG: cell envelope integrity protein CreD [Pseudomonadota bacterium]|nr:cell envelope integrity protein CreD [Pseudomonadota bacterium]
MSQPASLPKRRMGLKFLQIIAISACLGIVLFVICLLAWERSGRQEEALQSVTRGWGGVQTLAGPALAIPYTLAEVGLDQNNKPRTTWKTRMILMTPDEVSVDAALAPEKRPLGIYEALVYTADISIKGRFTPPDLSSSGIREKDVRWDEAFIVLPIADTVGLTESPTLALNGGKPETMAPGLHRMSNYNSKGVHIQTRGGFEGKPQEFSLRLKLRGSEALYFQPVGRKMGMTLSTPWSSVSAVGQFLPLSLETGEKGSRATWFIPSVAHGSAVAWTADEGSSIFENFPDSRYSIGKDSAWLGQVVGLRLWAGVDSYDSVVRSLKYGILFVGLTLLVLFLFEVVSRLRLHWTQYTLVGLAVCLFYLMLLSLSEHFAFGLSYLAAASGITAMVTLYAISVLGQRRRAGVLLFLLVALYTLFYLILKQEDYALLMGSGLLFVALAATMYLTRRIDWFDDAPEKPALR